MPKLTPRQARTLTPLQRHLYELVLQGNGRAVVAGKYRHAIKALVAADLVTATPALRGQYHTVYRLDLKPRPR